MRSARGSGVLMMGLVVAVGIWSAGPALGLDFLDDFNSYTSGTVPWPPGSPYTAVGPWTVIDLSAMVGAGHPFTVAIDDSCGPFVVNADKGILGMWDGTPGASPRDNIAVALRPEVFTDVSVRLKIRWSCTPVISCDMFDPFCRVDTEESNAFILLRNRTLYPGTSHPANGTFNCYGVELHDAGTMGIIKAVQLPPPNYLVEKRIKETRVAFNPARDVWLRVEVQTFISSTSEPSVRIRARAWQDDAETPAANDETAGIEDEPSAWNVVGDDYVGRDAWETSTPDISVDPYVWDGNVGIGWNEDGEGGSISNMVLDYVSGSTTLKGPGVVAGDFDGDGDVDLVDFGLFQSCFNGPNRPAACR